MADPSSAPTPEPAPDASTPAAQQPVTPAVDPNAVTLGQGDIEREREALRQINERPLFGRLKGYLSLSGPGWLQSAITLGGGSLASSLFLGILAGPEMMWVQPLAMVLGIVMLSAIGYVTLSTQRRPFRQINEHINPVLGWGWLLAAMAANIVWCLPQYALADSVLQNVLAPSVFGAGGTFGSMGEGEWWVANGGRVVLCLAIFIIALVITWSYDSGGKGLKIYETTLKILVALIVLSFLGVVVKLTMSEQGLDWSRFLSGFIPNFSTFFEPVSTYQPFLAQINNEAARQYWSDQLVSSQQDVAIAAAATAVGINMTFLFPYSLLRKGWNREYRGLTIFDLATGMFIPFLLATSCVVIAAASQFHGQPQDGFEFNEKTGEVQVAEGFEKDYNGWVAGREKAASAEGSELPKEVTIPEKRIAAMLVNRKSDHLAQSLKPLTGEFFANLVFGFGVVAMTLSTISILMLISGFVFAEIFNAPPGGTVHKIGTLVSGVAGAFGPFVWGDLGFYLAVPTSVFGLILLPLAYITFILMMNSRTVLGEAKPKGGRAFVWNILMLVAGGLATVAAVYMANKKIAEYLAGDSIGITGTTNLSIRIGILAAFVIAIGAGFVYQRSTSAVSLGDEKK